VVKIFIKTNVSKSIFNPIKLHFIGSQFIRFYTLNMHKMLSICYQHTGVRINVQLFLSVEKCNQKVMYTEATFD